MSASGTGTRVAMVTGATGQDGQLLLRRLLDEGLVVHALVRRPAALARWSGMPRLRIHSVDLLRPGLIAELIRMVRPDEFYNLAGLSSVARSFDDPEGAWQTNASAVGTMLEAVRMGSPHTRFYQASSSEMFGGCADGTLRNEASPLAPQSPYGASKAAAHLLCGVYRQSHGLRVACGILFNHESSLRPSHFLTRKVTDHVRRLRDGSLDELRAAPPLRVGNLRVRRDWGYAPEYVDGIVRIARQHDFRTRLSSDAANQDIGHEYKDYVLGTGRTSSVQELVDRAFAIAGLELLWDTSSSDASTWTAHFVETRTRAVEVDSAQFRPADPYSICADARVAASDLGWVATPGLDRFLFEMLGIPALGLHTGSEQP